MRARNLIKGGCIATVVVSLLAGCNVWPSSVYTRNNTTVKKTPYPIKHSRRDVNYGEEQIPSRVPEKAEFPFPKHYKQEKKQEEKEENGLVEPKVDYNQPTNQ